jgi:hypothetical protein
MTMAMGEWLIPLRRRGAPGPYNQNFLWRHKSIYVMDNHRAAMWCWLQHIDPRRSHSLLHIDRHYDALASRVDEWLENCPSDLERLNIDQYLNWDYPFGGTAKGYGFSDGTIIYPSIWLAMVTQ